MYVFEELFDTIQTITLGEGQGFGWFHLSELSSLDMIEHDREILLKLMK